jgi:hypothetical protein
MSQVHVSRLLRASLKRLRDAADADDAVALGADRFGGA